MVHLYDSFPSSTIEKSIVDPGKNSPERSESEYEQEIAALKKRIEWLSCQRYGRVLPGLLAYPAESSADGAQDDETASSVRGPVIARDVSQTALKPGRGGVLREPSAVYHVSGDAKQPEPPSSEEKTAFEPPSDLPEEDVTLELPPRERSGMTAVGFEDFEAIAARPAVVRRRIRRTMYAAMDGSGLAAAAPSPALFPDPSGSPLAFDASFAAWIAAMRVAGRSFRSIASDLKTGEALDVPESVLRGLFLAVAEMVAPVCSALFLHTLPDWNSLRRMFEEARSAGDWLADEFLKKIHALNVLEENARIRADRLGGAPEDLYRERRIARAQSQRIAGDLFARCRELAPTLAPETPLAETLRYAVEHESVLCEYLYDPRVEMAVAPPDELHPGPLAALEILAAECDRRGVFFRRWLEHALVMLKQVPPAPPETLFPR